VADIPMPIARTPRGKASTAYAVLVFVVPVSVDPVGGNPTIKTEEINHKTRFKSKSFLHLNSIGWR
jgi:hypothetical protein